MLIGQILTSQIPQHNTPVKNISSDQTQYLVDAHSQTYEMLYLNEIEEITLEKTKLLLAAHHNSKRASPLYFVFKLISNRFIKFGNCRTMQTTIGRELPQYGYDKQLGEKQISRHINKLTNAGLLTYRRIAGNIKQIELTRDGQIAFWSIVKNNEGRVRFFPESKKCPVIKEENVRSYIDSIIAKRVENKDSVSKLNKSIDEYRKWNENKQTTSAKRRYSPPWRQNQDDGRAASLQNFQKTQRWMNDQQEFFAKACPPPKDLRRGISEPT